MTASPEVTSVTVTCAAGSTALQGVEVAHRRGAGRDDHEPGLVEAGDGHVRLDPAALVEPRRVHEAPGLDGHVPRADAVQLGLRVAALDEQLPEGGLVEEGHALADRPVLLGGVREPVLAAIGVLVAGLHARRCVPVGPLPARDLAEARAACGEPVVERRAADPA